MLKIMIMVIINEHNLATVSENKLVVQRFIPLGEAREGSSEPGQDQMTLLAAL